MRYPVSTSAVAVVAVASLFAAASLDPLAQSMDRKLDLMRSAKARPGSVIFFSSAEINAWARAQIPTIAPDGIHNARLDLGNQSATAYATVNFAKLRRAQGESLNWLIERLIEGERPVQVNAHFQSAGGYATVFVDRVEISGLAVSGRTLDVLIRTFVLPLYPNAKVNEPFQLDDNVDRIDVGPAGARAYIKR